MCNDELYVVPVEECSTQKILRFSTKMNSSLINWAKDYCFEEVIKRI